VRTVAARQQEWDILVVLLHAGNEFYPYPRPRLREIARFMVEQGASAVIFQHSHCAGCREMHRGGHIIYGQGNLLFDLRGAQRCELEGFLAVLCVEKSGEVSLEVVPYRQSVSHHGPQRMNAEEEAEFMKAFEARSAAILDDGFVEREWDKFTQTSPYNYLALIHGYGQRVRELDLKFNFLRFRYSKHRMRMLLHLMRCESHREATIRVLANALKCIVTSVSVSFPS
jgi:poly-gamma-glutamate synthesis protein (capsule biosynthesis protein)